MDVLHQYQAIYDLVKLIPRGRVCNYGTIAKFAGPGFTARTVGRAMSASKNLKDLPAHRVVNGQGKLTGKMHFEHPAQMKELLEAEGILIKNDKVRHYQEHFWSPDELI